MIQACSGRAADVAARRALVCGHPGPAAELPHWQGVRRLQARVRAELHWQAMVEASERSYRLALERRRR